VSLSKRIVFQQTTECLFPYSGWHLQGFLLHSYKEGLWHELLDGAFMKFPDEMVVNRVYQSRYG